MIEISSLDSRLRGNDRGKNQSNLQGAAQLIIGEGGRQKADGG
jgi:hypothetical protein